MTPSASSITVSETLALLDTDHRDFADGVANGQYTFWLGAGISRGVVPDLGRLVVRVLEHLHDKMATGDPNDPFRQALTKIVYEIGQPTAEEQRRLDLDSPVASWPDLWPIVERLKGSYSQLLDVSVEGQTEADYLLWHGVDPVSAYGGATAPDVEHLCLAILALEGVANAMVSANWDGLIEAAVERLTANAAGHLKIVVLARDVQNRPGDTGRTELLKFHGCAVLAGRGTTDYREALVARASQITDWPKDVAHRAIRNEMVVLATQSRTVMIGLSAQDANIQDIFADAKSAMPWGWPSAPPALIFAEDRTGPWQDNLLKVAYGDRVVVANLPAVQRESLIRAFGKPLLTALVLYVLAQKAQVLVKAAAGGFPIADLDDLCDGVHALRNGAAKHAGGGTPAFLEQMLEVVDRAVTLFHTGVEPAAGPSGYSRLTASPASQLAQGATINSDGVRELAVALALFGHGVNSGDWSLSAVASGIRLTERNGDHEVFFAENGRAAVAMSSRGPASSTASGHIVVHCDDPAEPLPRSPSAPVGRTGSAASGEIFVRALLRDSDDLGELYKGFCLQAGVHV